MDLKDLNRANAYVESLKKVRESQVKLKEASAQTVNVSINGLTQRYGSDHTTAYFSIDKQTMLTLLTEEEIKYVAALKLLGVNA